MKLNDNQQALFALVKAGLWEQEVQLSHLGTINFSEVQRLAEEQSAVGLVAAGLEHVIDVKVPKQDVLQFVGQTLQFEQQNHSMNYFIMVIVDKMRAEGIETVLVKGQGIAQCYERPLWRACGDVDFLLDNNNYEKAKDFLIPIAAHVDKEKKHLKHLGMTLGSISVELHGTFRATISPKMDEVLDRIQNEMFRGNEFRTWCVDGTKVNLPSIDNDIIFVFSHILQHFFKGGIGIRQICDWNRLLWTYRDTINLELLESRLKEMRLLSEWRIFGALSVDVLGMPQSAFPLYKEVNKRKINYLLCYILEMGNLGHNRDMSFQRKGYPVLIRKFLTVLNLAKVNVGMMKIFPIDTVRFMLGYVHFKLKEQ